MDKLSIEIMPKIRAFLQEAGTLALKNQKNAKRSFKVDSSLVTETDLAISKMAHEVFDEYFSQDDHVLVDEETISKLGTPQEVLGKYKYTWVLDPIDGTVPYAYGRKNWAVSLGILKNDKPWISGIYLPSADELFLHDGNEAHFIMHAFTAEEKHEILTATPLEITSETPVDFCYGSIREYDFDYNCGKPSVLMCSVYGHISTIMRQSSGAVYNDSAWDFCGVWALARATGLEFRHLETGEVVNTLESELLTENWKKKSPWILSTKENFAILQKGITKKQVIKAA